MSAASLARQNAYTAALLMFQSDVEAALNTRNAEYQDIAHMSGDRYARADSQANQQIDSALARLQRSQETLNGEQSPSEDDDE